MDSNSFCGTNMVHLENSDADFKKNILNIPANSLIFVYRNGCGYCADAKKYFVNAKENNKNINFFAIDTGVANTLSSNFYAITKYKISGVPMYLYYDGSKYELYTGGRDTASISQFLKDKVLGANT